MSDLDKEEIEATRKMQSSAEKTADEMFEELGYERKYQICKDEVISIGYTLFDEPNDECSIMFLKKVNRLLVNQWITIQELKAINKKVEEMRVVR